MRRPRRAAAVKTLDDYLTTVVAARRAQPGDDLLSKLIDADLDAGIWEKAKIFLKIKNQAARIASAKPDLVITVGTPATKYSKEKIIGAGILPARP